MDTLVLAIICTILGIVVGFSEGYTYRILEEAREDAKKAQEHLEKFLKGEIK
jgi:hypothetical protein